MQVLHINLIMFHRDLFFLRRRQRSWSNPFKCTRTDTWSSRDTNGAWSTSSSTAIERERNSRHPTHFIRTQRIGPQCTCSHRDTSSSDHRSTTTRWRHNPLHSSHMLLIQRCTLQLDNLTKTISPAAGICHYFQRLPRLNSRSNRHRHAYRSFHTWPTLHRTFSRETPLALICIVLAIKCRQMYRTSYTHLDY